MSSVSRFAVVAVTLSSALIPLAGVRAADGARPNVLFLITDQQTAGALSCAGNPYVKTPHMDRLAARGVRFEKSYCTYPLCCPSRGSLFTSRMPHELRIYTNADAELAGKGLQVRTMGELFQAAGYETAYAGKWHLQVPFPAFKRTQIPGFQMLPLAGNDPHAIDKAKQGKGLTVDPNTADACIKFLRQPHQKPFLLVASILNPHDICEYPKCAALRNLLPADPAKLPPARPNLRDTEKIPSSLEKSVSQKGQWTERQWREFLYVYYRLTEISDGEVGRVLAALEETHLDSKTVVVFTADHGEMMGSHQLVHKQKLYEESAAVPLVVATPGGRVGSDKTHLVSGLDILPTVLDYAGIAAPASLEGKSLRPLVEGKEVPWREFVASEVNMFAEARMVRTARYKYVAFASGDNREQFFDMEIDPGELKNLIDAPGLSAEIARHRGLLEQWRRDTHDEIGSPQAVPKGRKAKPGRQNAAKTHAAGEQPPQDRAALFDRKDGNHDGKLSLQEFLAKHPDPEVAKKHFEQWDVDKDGFLSRDEFKSMRKKSK